MANLTIAQLIKIILGIAVAVAVIVGLGFFFKDTLLGFFGNYGNRTATDLIGSLI